MSIALLNDILLKNRLKIYRQKYIFKALTGRWKSITRILTNPNPNKLKNSTRDLKLEYKIGEKMIRIDDPY